MRHFPVHHGMAAPDMLSIEILIDREILADILRVPISPLCGYATGQMPPQDPDAGGLSGLSYAFKEQHRAEARARALSPSMVHRYTFTHDLRQLDCKVCRVRVDRELERGNMRDFGSFLFLLSAPDKITAAREG